MSILNYAGAPGAGKSRAMMTEIVRSGGQWLMACPRIDLIRERMGAPSTNQNVVSEKHLSYTVSRALDQAARDGWH